MSIASIYTLTYHPGKSLTAYLDGVKKAQFCQSKMIQIDWNISSQDFFDSLMSEIKAIPLRVAIKCSAEQLSEVQCYAKDLTEVHVYFSHSSEIRNAVSKIKNENLQYRFILMANRRSDFTNIGKLFSDQSDADLYFVFAPYVSKDQNSLRAREVAKIAGFFSQTFPKLQVRPLPGLELYDENIDVSLDLEPLLDSPRIELKIHNSEIKYSFIIPTYNSKHFLSNVIKHILQQSISREKFEIIVVDDGSSDDSAIYIDSFLVSEGLTGNLRYFYWPKPITKPFEKPVFRAGLCRNIGANNAKGTHFIFLDSDILVPESFLFDLEQCFKNNDVIQYVRHHIKPDKSTSYVNQKTLDLTKDVYIEEESYWGPYFNHNKWSEMPYFWKYTCTYCLALSKKDFFSVGRFRRAFVSYGFEDTDLGYRLFKKGLRFHLSKLATLHLTPPIQSMNSGGYQYKRFLALSKTAKIFFLSNLDLEIYNHFHNYMGGERELLKEALYWFDKFRRRLSREPKKFDALMR